MAQALSDLASDGDHAHLVDPIAVRSFYRDLGVEDDFEAPSEEIKGIAESILDEGRT